MSSSLPFLTLASGVETDRCHSWAEAMVPSIKKWKGGLGMLGFSVAGGCGCVLVEGCTVCVPLSCSWPLTPCRKVVRLQWP